VATCKKLRGHCRQKLVLAFSHSVFIASTRSRLSQVRNKKKDHRQRKIQGMIWGRERGERRNSTGKRRSRESEKREQEEREERGTPKLFGVIAIRSRFSPFLPVHNLLLLSRLFSFSSFPTTVLNTLSSKVRPPPCFSSSACIPTALYACKLHSRVRIKKEEKRRETDKRGRNATEKTKKSE